MCVYGSNEWEFSGFPTMIHYNNHIFNEYISAKNENENAWLKVESTAN